MSLEFDVKVTAKMLYDFLLHHTYNSPSGILGTVVGALGIVVFGMNRQPIYLIMGIILIAYLPVTLWTRAQKQALNPVFKEPVHYKMTEEGLEVSQGETVQLMKWEDMHKACSTGRSILLYTNPVSACVFPRKELDEQILDIIEFISTHMPAKKVQIRM